MMTPATLRAAFGMAANAKQESDATSADLSQITNDGQIAGMVVLTESEYAALEGTASDDVLYLITADA